ncbi:MAG TPA: hypothetical protein VKM54_20290 [Myxococcota bacterium]|nr:hypothetical protein [Myxococcota bacterium]
MMLSAAENLNVFRLNQVLGNDSQRGTCGCKLKSPVFSTSTGFGERQRGPVPAGDADPIAVIEELWQKPFARVVDAARFGQAVLGRRDELQPPRVFTCAPRTSSHVRHWHKYARAQLPADLCFHFHKDTGEPTYEAGNLEDFHRALTACAPATIRFHAPRGDFSRWIRHVIHDDELSATVRELESKVSNETPDAEVDVVRAGLLSAIEERYLE